REVSDSAELRRMSERRVTALSGCDGLLLLGTDDTRALDADLVVVGRQERQLARARSNRPLPCGLLDMVGASLATQVRRASARALQADWIDATRPAWGASVKQWIADRGRQAGAVA